MTGAEPSVIHCDQFIAHPPAAVWRVLTDPELHARWWAAGDVRPVVGHRFTLDMGPWGQQACEVLAVEPERLLRYSFAPRFAGHHDHLAASGRGDGHPAVPGTRRVRCRLASG